MSLAFFSFQGLSSGGAINVVNLKIQVCCQCNFFLQNGQKSIEKNNGKDWFFTVQGITVNDHFQAVDKYGRYNELLYSMAVPYIGGFNSVTPGWFLQGGIKNYHQEIIRQHEKL